MNNHKSKIVDKMMLLFCCVLIVYFGKYRVFDKPGLWFGDEIGYFSSAAYSAGFDWSNLVSKQLGYFGLGYGLFLIPGFLICNSAVQLMNYTMVLNIVFLLISFFVGVRLLLKLTGESFFVSCIGSLVATLYVNNLAQLHMGWSESLNLMLYWLALNALLDIVERSSVFSYIRFALILSFSVIVHMRNISLATVGTIVLLLWIKEKKSWDLKRILVFAGVVFAMAIIFFVSKDAMQDLVWRIDGEAQINDVSGYAENATNIARYITISSIFDTIMSKIFYIISTTYGMIVLGTVYAIKNRKNYVNIFAISIFGVNFIWTAYNMMFPMRYDAIYYARYYEPTIGLLVAYGFISIGRIWRSRWKTVGLFPIILVLYKYAYLISSSVSDATVEAGYISGTIFPCMAGFGKYIFHDGLSHVPISALKNFLGSVFIIMMICILGYWLAVRFIKVKIHIRNIVMICVAVILIFNWVDTSRVVIDKMIYFEDEAYTNVIPIAEQIKNKWNNDEDNVFFYTTGEADVSILYLQLLLGKTNIEGIDSLKQINDADSYIVLYKGAPDYLTKYEATKEAASILSETESLVLFQRN